MDSHNQPAHLSERDLAELRERVAVALAAEEWGMARAMAEAALQQVPRDADLLEALQQAQWGEWLAARYQAAREHMQAGRWAEAIAHLDALLSQKDTEYFARAAAYHDALGLRQQAQEHLEAEPQLAAWYEQGVAALRAGDSQTAADAFREVVKRRAHYRDSARQLAAALAALERQRAGAVLRAGADEGRKAEDDRRAAADGNGAAGSAGDVGSGSAPPAVELPPPAPHSASAVPPPVVPPAHVAPAADESAPRVMIGRTAVLGALYQQGISALRRGDYAAAVDALVPVVEEAPDAYPDVVERLAEARAGVGAPMPNAGRRVAGNVAAGGAPAASAASVPPLAAQPARAAAPLPAAAPPPAGADFAPPEQRGGRWRWVLGAVALVILAGIVAVVVAGPPAPPPVDEAAPSATLVPVADLFTSCNDTVAAEDWAGAIAACRRVYARDAAYAGLADKLAAAYVGRGKQRLADSGDLSGAESDFGEALRYKSDDEAAQQQAQRVYLYKEGDKAITAEDWENAVGQLGAVYGDDPDYLSTQGERAVRQKLGGAWRSWGRAALAEDDKPSAAQRCAQALQILPDDADATRCVDDAGGLPAAGDPAGDFPPGEGPEGMPPGSQPPPGAQPPPR